MRPTALLATALALATSITAQSTAGLTSLLARRMPNHINSFTFTLVNSSTLNSSNSSVHSSNIHESYSVSSTPNGTVAIEGTTISALSQGLHRYTTEVLHLDVHWFVGSRLWLAPSPLPEWKGRLTGQSTVAWRYHFNTVTFDYTAAWWTWEDWELELDWLALRGVNLPLAWVGYEYFLIQSFQEVGFTDDEIASFLSGPPFQAWNRFGNLAGSWAGELPFSWVDQQYALQKQIIARMVELGMTPVLPGFAGFVPRAISRIAPNASFVNGSNWENFPVALTNTTFLEPSDPLFYTLQKKIVQKQQVAYGNVSHIYTIDSYNENSPQSSDPAYLASVSSNTVASLKAADPSAIWMLQGWLFYSLSTFWTANAIKAFLSDIPNNDIIILDLFSESQPQWQRTNAYYGKPFIWCQLHDYGGNQGLYGQVENVTVNAVQALRNASNLVGFGNTMEGQEGNEIMYDLMLDQAWSATAINTSSYFYNWTTNRYSTGPASVAHIPEGLYTAWESLRTTVYNNTNLTSSAVPKAIYELQPNISGLLNRTGHHPTTLNYDPSVVTNAWQLFHNVSLQNPSLYDNPVFAFDFVDLTRQVMANAFIELYENFVAVYASTANASASGSNGTTAANATVPSAATMAKVQAAGQPLLELLMDLDAILATNENFRLSTWLDDALGWTNSTSIFTPSSSPSPCPSSSTSTSPFSPASNATLPLPSSPALPSFTNENSTGSPVASYYIYSARNQLTLWGPSGQISDYASKSWAGLIGGYYLPRWTMFVNYCARTGWERYNASELQKELRSFEMGWQVESWGGVGGDRRGEGGKLGEVLGAIVGVEGAGAFGL